MKGKQMGEEQTFWVVWSPAYSEVQATKYELRCEAIFEAERLSREIPDVRWYIGQMTEYVVTEVPAPMRCILSSSTGSRALGA